MEENTIAIKFVGNEQAGGGDQPRPPVGSSQDTAKSAAGDLRPNQLLDDAFAENLSESISQSVAAGLQTAAEMRSNPLLDEAFGAEAFTSAQQAGGPTASDIMRERNEEARRKREEDEAKAKADADQKAEDEEYAARRDRVFSGLGRQAAQEQARQAREDEQQRQKEERELNAELKRQYREQEAEKRKEQRELDADLKRQYREQEAQRRKGLRDLEAEKKRFEREDKQAAQEAKRKEQEEKAATQDQRLRYLQFGQGAGQLLSAQGVGGKASGFMQVAGSGFLGKGLEGFANSPTGGAIMAAGALVDTADHLIKNAFAAQREAVRGVGNVGKAIFQNNYGEAGNQAVEGVAAVFEKIPIAGTLLAESMRSTADAVNVFGELVNSAAQRGKELEKYSAGIAGTAAQAEVRTIMRDVQEAQRNEQTYSRIIDSQSRIEDAQRAVMDPIKDALLTALADVVEPVAEIAEDLKPLLRMGSQGTAVLIRIGAAIATLPLETLARVIDGFAKWLNLPQEEIPNLLDELDRTVENIRNGTAARGPMPEKKPDRDNKQKAPKFFG